MSDELPPFLGVTPFGPYCKVCNISLSIKTGILTHGKEVHAECHFKNATVIRDVYRRMSLLRNSNAGDLSPFLTTQCATDPTWFCTGCFRSFANAFNYSRHLERNNECQGHLGGRMECYVTICGRVAPKNYTIVSTKSTSTIVSSASTVSTLTDSIFHSSIYKKKTKVYLLTDRKSKLPTRPGPRSEAGKSFRLGVCKPVVRLDCLLARPRGIKVEY